VLHPVGRRITCGFGKLPAVLPFDGTDEPTQVGRGALAQFYPPKSCPDPSRHGLQAAGPLLGRLHRRLVDISRLFMVISSQGFEEIILTTQKSTTVVLVVCYGDFFCLFSWVNSLGKGGSHAQEICGALE
jgi:hypothetical protein